MKAEVYWATSVQVIRFRKLKTWPGADASRRSGPAAGGRTRLHQQGTGPCPSNSLCIHTPGLKPLRM